MKRIQLSSDIAARRRTLGWAEPERNGTSAVVGASDALIMAIFIAACFTLPAMLLGLTTA